MDHTVTTLDALTALYGEVNPMSLAKETNALTPHYQKWIEAAPFFALASIGPGGMDCSPRGDHVGEVFAVLDNRTLAIPDRRGNNRLDTLRNIVHDPRVALMFMIPGINEAMRINGRATVSVDPDLIARFAINGKAPTSVIVVKIEAVYFQCARAMKRAKIWDANSLRSLGDIPSAGEMTKAVSENFDAKGYDEALQERQNSSLY